MKAAITPGVLEQLLAQLESVQRQLRDASQAEVIRLRANAHFWIHGPDGELKDEWQIHNLVVTAGRRVFLASGGTAKYLKDFAWCAIGTGAAAAALGDTTLGAEVARVAATVSNPDSDTLRVSGAFGAGVGTGAITESGLFNASSSGTMLNRLVFSAYNKGALDSLTSQIDLT
jgi:ElaB/YqjD/DUF883 family membrane-anchored ribosome-binding protein